MKQLRLVFLFVGVLTIGLSQVQAQLVCYQCEDCAFQQEIPVVCSDIDSSTTTDTTCPTCAPEPSLPTTPALTTSTPIPTISTTLTPTTPIPTTPTPETTCPTCAPTLPTTPIPTTPTPETTCPTARSTSVFAMAARAAKASLLNEFEEEIRSPRQLPLPVYVCFTTERMVSNRRVISRGCTKRQQSLTETCVQLTGGQSYDQCSLCSWQLCNR
uniref:Uncharacterized protein n=1 Tax=Anopheles albimanus TaxID=7167 RepID=A0A182F2M9_ANOAL